MKKRKKNNYTFAEMFIIVIVFAITLFIGNYDFSYSTNNDITYDTNLKIYFVDVGQADSILVTVDNKYALVDAGNNEDGNLLVKYFKSLGISDFEYVFGTHAHEDHIGGMDNIIKNFKINNFYMPDVITTTKTFEDVLDALEDNNVSLDTPNVGDTFKLGNADFKVLHVSTDSSDINNTSIVLKLTYGSTCYLLMGDATSKVESKINNQDLKCDVLKVGHHGSQYSSTDSFIKNVNPKYAIISVGKGNTYNHPTKKALDILKKYNAEIHRTDEEGTILIESDGKEINISNFKTETNG